MDPVVTLLWVGLVVFLWVGVVAGIWAMLSAGAEYPSEVSKAPTNE
ncbi:MULTISPECIES: hypothetical protein [Halorussus]|nr:MULTISPECIES: hypothetical protein [Halorussus]NHN57481.1 hypothetical protein [Halorussus sp. JP-T4]